MTTNDNLIKRNRLRISSMPLRRVIETRYVHAWNPYRIDKLECGHVISMAPAKESQRRRCAECEKEAR